MARVEVIACDDDDEVEETTDEVVACDDDEVEETADEFAACVDDAAKVEDAVEAWLLEDDAALEHWPPVPSMTLTQPPWPLGATV